MSGCTFRLGQFEVESDGATLIELIQQERRRVLGGDIRVPLSLRCRPYAGSSPKFSHSLFIFVLPESPSDYVRERIRLLEDAFQNQVLNASQFELLDSRAGAVLHWERSWYVQTFRLWFHFYTPVIYSRNYAPIHCGFIEVICSS
jgi:Lon protease-like protein